MTFDEWITALLPTPHTASIEAFQGGAGYGDSYATAVSVTPCFVDHKRRQVRGADGSTVISTASLYAPAGTDGQPRSRVTLPDGTVTAVIARAVFDDAGTGLPAHVQFDLE